MVFGNFGNSVRSALGRGIQGVQQAIGRGKMLIRKGATPVRKFLEMGQNLYYKPLSQAVVSGIQTYVPGATQAFQLGEDILGKSISVARNIEEGKPILSQDYVKGLVGALKRYPFPE